MADPIGGRLTILIPTYNRFELLRDLLGYLTSIPMRPEILVVDSSDAQTRERNKALVEAAARPVLYVEVDATVSPFEKFALGASLAATEFCALCADDDVVLFQSLPEILDFLSANPGYVAAHGRYLRFSVEGGGVLVRSVAYAGPSLDGATPLRRLQQFLDDYEAITYAVYRTEVLRDALGTALRTGSLLARELLAGATAVVAGKVARLPVFYYARNEAPSNAYTRWHPAHWLSSDPHGMFREYGHYRSALLDRLAKAPDLELPPEEAARAVDLAHLVYLSRYLAPEALRHILARTLAGDAPEEVVRGLWPLVEGTGGLWGRLRRIGGLRRLRDALAPRLNRDVLARLRGPARSVVAQGGGGRPREIRFADAFVRAACAGADERVVDGLAAQLSHYAPRRD
jgi:glycosyltransferase domain-containing protein